MLRIRQSDRIHRGARRLDDDGGRPSTLDGLWNLAHQRLGDSFAAKPGRRALLDLVCPRVSSHLLHGLLVHGAIDPARSCAPHPNVCCGGRTSGKSDPGAAAARIGRRGAVMNNSISFVGVWTALVALGVYIYVLLDGFDLGIGILYGLSTNERHRDLMMRSIALVWDGNETW